MTSEQVKASIEAQRCQISQMEHKIVGLNQQLRTRHTSGVNGRPHVDTEAIHEEISRLEDSISILQGRIVSMQSNLPLLIASEQAAAQMDRDFAEKERQEAAADRARHDAAVKASALAQWLLVPGQSQAGFEQAWPTIAGQIAMQAAVQAGAVESTVAHDSPMRIMAANALAIRYGRKVSEPE